MLFSSAEFIFIFLPATLALFWVARRINYSLSLAVLAALSLVFYGYHKPVYVFLILTSIGWNFVLGRRLRAQPSKLLLALAVAGNLALLGYFKYAGLTVATLAVVTSQALSVPQIVLPLAISFFTFQQIAYVVDSYNGKTIQDDFLKYAVFVSFFPQLIAGPIVKQQHVMVDINAGRLKITMAGFAPGVTLFLFGLFKKVIVADHFAAIADPSFAAVAVGQALTTEEAWLGLLAYSLQIYFDFSAYSDMAIGIGMIFGLSLPVNFNSPYKARSIIDFWRRWHMTLSAFLRDYLYVPLGGNRQGPWRRHLNLMIVMLLGGLWHGADWAFVLWGGLHGFYLIVNHGYRKLAETGALSGIAPLVSLIGWPLTFLAVALAWVPFRANGLEWVDYYGELFAWDFRGYNGVAAGTILAGLALAFFAPNLARIFGLGANRSPLWRPDLAWFGAASAVLCVTFFYVLLGEAYEFIYFEF